MNDYLGVYDGHDETDVILRACGQTAPADVTSSRNMAMLEFRADDNGVAGLGFAATYRTGEN